MKPLRHIQDAEWLDRFRNGDERAFAEVYEAQKNSIYSYSLVLLHYDIVEAEDTVSFAFIQLWRNRAKIETADHMTGFLFMAARNRITNHHILNKRKLKAQKRLVAGMSEIDEPAIDFERAHAEMINRIIIEVEQLPAYERDLVEKHYFAKRTGVCAAKAHGRSEASTSRDRARAESIVRDRILNRAPAMVEEPEPIAEPEQIQIKKCMPKTFKQDEYHPSEKELAVLQGAADGDTFPEIAGKAHYSIGTVGVVRGEIYKKMECRNFMHAVTTALRKGWIK